MAIPASKIVSVTPRIIPSGARDFEISGLILTENPLAPFPNVLQFDSKAAVKSCFGAESEEYALAVNYFLGYDNSFRKPKKLHFARRVKTDLAAFLIGSKLTASLADFKAITIGSFKIVIDDTLVTINDLDLSAATSLSDIATKISTKLVTATCAYSTIKDGFVITSKTLGAISSVGYMLPAAGEQDLSMMLGMSEQSGASMSIGSAELTAGENMDAIVDQTQNFVTFTNIYEATDDEILALAAWSSSQGVEYLYCLWSNNSALISQSSGNTIAEKIMELDYTSVTAMFGTAKYAAFIMGVAGSIDWNRRNGAINFAFKTQSGLAATVTDGNTADIVLKRKFNFYGRYATRNDSFIFMYDGTMYGEYRFIDPYINAIWLRNVIQVSLMSGITASPRTPYTPAGYTKIRAWMTDPVERALQNGVIESGVVLSESQKAELYSEAGMDISMEIFTKGYYLQILDPGPSARINRDSPIINLWYSYGGSINRLEVPISALL